MSLFLILLAAGNNKRFKSSTPKPYHLINKKTVLEHSLEAFKNIRKIKKIVIVYNSKHRKNLTDQQKKEYSELFKKYFLKSFSSRLAEYSNPKIDVTSQEKKSEKYTIVSSILIATDQRPEVKIDWRVYTKNPEKPLIRDLIIERLSLARTQKEEFHSIIQSNDGDINALFVSL